MNEDENKTSGSGSIQRALPELKVELPRDIFTPREDEYVGKDGELHCNYCKGLRSHTYKGRRMRCICHCQEWKRDMRELERNDKAKYDAIQQIIKASLVATEYQTASFDTTDTGRSESFDKAFDLCKRYCESLDLVEKHGQGLYLYGSLGCGKTHLAACMANAIIKQCKTVLFTNFFKIMSLVREKKRKGGKESDVLDRLTVVDFLFIDDLGAERVSANGEDTWVQEYIFNILNDRLSNRKPTIFTSNYGLKELRDEKGLQPRICDRIARMVSWANVKIEAPNYRREQIKKQEPIF